MSYLVISEPTEKGKPGEQVNLIVDWDRSCDVEPNNMVIFDDGTVCLVTDVLNEIVVVMPSSETECVPKTNKTQQVLVASNARTNTNKKLSPKEKAKELYNKMLEVGDEASDFVYDASAKNSALIAINETIEEFRLYVPSPYKGHIKHLEEIKAEIEKIK